MRAPTAPAAAVAPAAGPAGLTLAAFAAFSVASGLFFFGCFKLMNFHWISMSVLVSLLLVGMPIGGFVAVRYLTADLLSLSLGFSLQVVAMLVTLALFPLFLDPASRIDQLLTGTLQVSGLTFMVIKFTQLSLVFAPYFVAFGLNEFLGYRLALPIVRGRSELAYALFLGATSLAYVVIEFGSPRLGVVPLMVGGAGAIALVAAALRRRFAGRGRLIGAFGLVLALGAWAPGLEDRYITALELEGPLQLRTLRRQPGADILYRGWGRYCHLSVAARSPTAIMGFYNGGLHWYHRTDRTREQLERLTFETVPFSMLPSTGAEILIIGSGGGEQVRTALMHDPARVVAVEIIPEVLTLLGGPLGARVGHIYEDPRVVTAAMDGRRYLEQTDATFDLIFLPVVDTSITMMRSLFNPAETLYTVEAFAAMRRHLKPDGVLVIQRPAFFDQYGVLLRQYVRALADLGMHPYVWLDNPRALRGEARPGISEPAFSTDPVYLIFARRTAAGGQLPPAAEARLRQKGFVRAEDFGAFPYQAKTDDFLFRSNMLFNILGGSPLNRSLAAVIVVTFAIVLVVVELLRRMFARRAPAPPAPFWALLGLGVLVGLNFLLLEQFLIFKLFRILERPMDAMFLGTVGFMMLTAAAGLVLTPRLGVVVAVLAAAAAAAAVLGGRAVAPETVTGVLVALPLVVVTGTLFPSIFRGGEAVLLVVFAADALGALAGGLVAFLWPIAYGFQSYDRLTLVCFVLTGLAVVWARRRWRLV